MDIKAVANTVEIIGKGCNKALKAGNNKQEIASVFSEIARPEITQVKTATNPFVMDAKAHLSVLQIKKSTGIQLKSPLKPVFEPKKITWQELIQNMEKDKQRELQKATKEAEKTKFDLNKFPEEDQVQIKQLLDELKTHHANFDKEIEKLNPFNQNNFKQSKSVILKHIDSINNPHAQDFAQEVIECKNPSELFSLFKNDNFLERLEKQYNSTKYEKLFDYGTKIEEALAKSAEKEISPYLKLLNPSAPKSTNPKVIQIENEIKEALEHSNIKDINCSDNLELAQNIMTSLENFSKRLETNAEQEIPKIMEDCIPLSGLEKNFTKLFNERAFFNRKLMDALTQKSTNPEVLKIEQQIRGLGVKEVNCSNDLNMAKSIKSAVEDMIKTKSPVPESFTVSPLLDLDVGGHTEILFAPNKRIYLPHYDELLATDILKNKHNQAVENCSVLKQYPNIKQDCLLPDNFNYSSTEEKAKGFIFHESEHARELSTMRGHFLDILTDEEMTLAKGIPYAEETGKIWELRAEIYRKLMKREAISKEQMNWYVKHDGTVPQF